MARLQLIQNGGIIYLKRADTWNFLILEFHFRFFTLRLLAVSYLPRISEVHGFTCSAPSQANDSNSSCLASNCAASLEFGYIMPPTCEQTLDNFSWLVLAHTREQNPGVFS